MASPSILVTNVTFLYSKGRAAPQLQCHFLHFLTSLLKAGCYSMVKAGRLSRAKRLPSEGKWPR